MAAARARFLIEDLLQALRAESQALAAGREHLVGPSSMRKVQLLQHLTEAADAAIATDATTRALLHEAQRLNDLNGELVAARMAMTRARADALLQAAEAATVYGARGSVRSLGGSGHAVTRA